MENWIRSIPVCLAPSLHCGTLQCVMAAQSFYSLARFNIFYLIFFHYPIIETKTKKDTIKIRLTPFYLHQFLHFPESHWMDSQMRKTQQQYPVVQAHFKNDCHTYCLYAGGNGFLYYFPLSLGSFNIPSGHLVPFNCYDKLFVHINYLFLLHQETDISHKL